MKTMEKTEWLDQVIRVKKKFHKLTKAQQYVALQCIIDWAEEQKETIAREYEIKLYGRKEHLDEISRKVN